MLPCQKGAGKNSNVLCGNTDDYARNHASFWDGDLGFASVDPAETGRPAYHPAPLLKLYIYGYLNPCIRAAGLSGSASAIWR